MQVLTVLLKTLKHCFPDFGMWLQTVPDPRDLRFITYPISYLLTTGILMFLTKLGSRRQIRYQFNTPAFIRNVNLLCGTSAEAMEHPDTLAYLSRKMDIRGLEDLRRAMMVRLIRMKCFERDRLLGKYYRIAIDGTGYLTYRQRHCDQCLTRKRDGEIISYYHPVLEAKLVTRSGFSLSIGTEFIENPQVDVDKQDCERKAFVRLARRLKQDFPQLRICLLLDSLYACGPVFDLCRQMEWRYIITFKEGSAPQVFAEYERLRVLGGESHFHKQGEVSQKYAWVNGVEFSGHRVRVLECREPERRYVWVTDLVVSETTCVALGNSGGRLRWKIENEGFNAQKTGGYEMEHDFCGLGNAPKAFYLLLQIAHILGQLMEKGLLRKKLSKHFGAIRNVARFLLEELRHKSADLDQLIPDLLDRRIQIRFAVEDSS